MLLPALQQTIQQIDVANSENEPDDKEFETIQVVIQAAEDWKKEQPAGENNSLPLLLLVIGPWTTTGEGRTRA